MLANSIVEREAKAKSKRIFSAHFSYFLLQLITSPIKIHFSLVINCICEQCLVVSGMKESETGEKLAKVGDCVYANDGHLWKRHIHDKVLEIFLSRRQSIAKWYKNIITSTFTS